jgi:hypothetical protein
MPMPLLVAAWFAACTNPAHEAAADYVVRIQPLLLENSALSEQMLLEAAAIYNEAAGPKDVAEVWERRIVPMSEHLAAQAALTQAPPEYAPTHARLVQIWTDRALAYRIMSEATRTANAELWNASRTKVDEVMANENQFFRDLNTQLAPSSLSVDAYP